MANQNQIEQCIVTLTQLVTQNNQPQNWRNRIEKEIRYLPTFQGEPGTLPSFIDSVTRALTDHPNEADRVFQIIYNTKILGKAKNLLNVNPPANWTTCKQRLRKHYTASKDQMTITREIGNLRVFNIVIIFLAAITATQGLLQVNQINEESGYLQIRLREVEIVNQTSTVLHIIDPNEINNILSQIETNLEELDIDNKNLIKTEIKTIRAKIKSIMPNDIRRKRGLINFVGTAQKWLFGTMNDDDRQEILEHLKVVDENNHNAITTLNKQISINTHFNETIDILKNAVEEDRMKMSKAFDEVRKQNNKIVKHSLYLDQMVKLRYLENKINQIQDNIASAKHNMIHPSILTAEEIEAYQIDFYKLKLIKVGIMKYKDQLLVIAIKIPQNYIRTDLKLITPLPNKDYLEIEENNEYIGQIDNKVLAYQEDTMLKDLKSSKNCIWNNQCKFRYNNKTKIEVLDDETLLIKNAVKEELIQNCDDRIITLNKNYFVTFYNCEIKLYQETFYNQKKIMQDKYFYPSNKFTQTYVKAVTFDSIVFNHFENIKEIQELKFHKTISYGISLTLIVIVIISVIVIIIWQKGKRSNIKIINKKEIIHKDIQEKSNSNRGGVMYVTGNVTLPEPPEKPQRKQFVF